MANYVYFMRRENGDIKIGYSNDVEGRRRTVRTEQKCDVEILGAMPGSRQDETALHARYAHVRVDGEWFTPCEELECFIRENTSLDGLEKVSMVRLRKSTIQDLRDFAGGLDCSVDEAVAFLIKHIREENEHPLLAGYRMREQLQFLTATPPAAIDERKAS